MVGMMVEAIGAVIATAVSAIAFVIAAIAGLCGLYISASRWSTIERKLDDATDRHLDALVRQRVTLIYIDPYGKPVLNKWSAEVSSFINQRIFSKLTLGEQSLLKQRWTEAFQRVCHRIEDAAQKRPAIKAVSSSMTPPEFESFCAEKLRACGWQVQITPPGRDQGVDVIAEKNGVRAVLQCKLYSKPVGNKAVQEIAAGRTHQQAHHGVVVTNNAYTTSARQLATTNRILLLHHSDLSQLERMLCQPVAQ